MSNSSVEENRRLIKTLDDAWNSQDWDTFNVRHAEDAIVCPSIRPGRIKKMVSKLCDIYLLSIPVCRGPCV